MNFPRTTYSSPHKNDRQASIKTAEYLKGCFNGTHKKETMIIDARANDYCRYLKEDQQGNRTNLLSYMHNSSHNRMVIKGLVVLADNDGLRKAMHEEDFKIMVSANEPFDRSNVNFWLKGKSAKKILEINNMTNKVKLRYPITGVLK